MNIKFALNICLQNMQKEKNFLMLNLDSRFNSIMWVNFIVFTYNLYLKILKNVYINLIKLINV